MTNSVLINMNRHKEEFFHVVIITERFHDTIHIHLSFNDSRQFGIEFFFLRDMCVQVKKHLGTAVIISNYYSRCEIAASHPPETS
jgi:hypothetical protein